MISAIRSRITYSNVVATLALFFALAGTASAAVIITSNSEVAQDTISGHHPPSGDHSNLIVGSVNGQDIQDGGIGTGEIAGNAVGTGKLANNAVTSAKISDGEVQNADLGSNAVNTFKIADGQVLSVDLGSGSVDSTKVADNSLTGGDILNRGLSDSDIGSPAQVNGADIPAIAANACIALQLNFGGWTQVGELVIAQARDGGLGTGVFITPLVVKTAGSASGRVCNVTTSTQDPAPEDILAWSIRQ